MKKWWNSLAIWVVSVIDLLLHISSGISLFLLDREIIEFNIPQVFAVLSLTPSSLVR